jgi:iron-sulfur cluster assembly accessory protein
MTVSIHVTDRAARRISEIISGEAETKMLRVSVKAGGCTGFQYSIDLVADRDQGDEVSLPFMAGSEIDFVDDLIGASFKISNPNATASCGCGTSFTV